jgi:hypothetical protein
VSALARRVCGLYRTVVACEVAFCSCLTFTLDFFCCKYRVPFPSSPISCVRNTGRHGWPEGSRECWKQAPCGALSASLQQPPTTHNQQPTPTSFRSQNPAIPCHNSQGSDARRRSLHVASILSGQPPRVSQPLKKQPRTASSPLDCTVVGVRGAHDDDGRRLTKDRFPPCSLAVDHHVRGRGGLPICDIGSGLRDLSHEAAHAASARAHHRGYRRSVITLLGSENSGGQSLRETSFN